MELAGELMGREQHRGVGGAVVPLYAIFTLTGVGTALLGATLPVMLVYWRLTDASAGALFLLLFVASSSGSLVPRPNTRKMIAGASVLLALCCAALAVTYGQAVFPVTAAFGFGLGLAISTVTRVCLSCPQEERVKQVNGLNVFWGLGAFLCPTLANEIIRHEGVRVLFLTLAGVFAAAAAWTLAAAGKRGEGAAEPEEDRAGQSSLPWLAAVGAILAVGLESSLGAWLATYTHRLQSGFRAPVEATTLFWLGLLSSRALCSRAWVRRFTERQLLLGFIGLAAAGCAVLVSFPRGGLVVAAALLLGAGVGPVYPILQAAVLPRVRGNLVLVLGGVGAALFPWLTGALSQHFGSLRVGLAAPVFAGAALLAIAPALAAALQRLEAR